MTAEVGKKCIAVPSRSGGYSYADGHVPDVGERVMAYPLPDGTYFVMPVPAVSVGDTLTISPELVPIGGGGGGGSGWSWNGWGYIYTGTGSYSSILETSGDVGTFGVYISGGSGCWSSVTQDFPGWTFSHLDISINVGETTHPMGKFTKISINNTLIYNKSAAQSGMNTWIDLHFDFSTTESPVLKIECDCPSALRGTFALSVKNLLFS